MQINLFKFFSNKSTYILEKHVPITRLSLKEMKSSNKPWLTKGTLKLINRKNAIYIQEIYLSQKSPFQRKSPLRI